MSESFTVNVVHLNPNATIHIPKKESQQYSIASLLLLSSSYFFGASPTLCICSFSRVFRNQNNGLTIWRHLCACIYVYFLFFFFFSCLCVTNEFEKYDIVKSKQSFIVWMAHWQKSSNKVYHTMPLDRKNDGKNIYERSQKMIFKYNVKRTMVYFFILPLALWMFSFWLVIL